MLTEEENIEKIKTRVKEIVGQSDKSIFLVIDGDRTLISKDSTKYFFQYLDLDFNDIKSIFKKYEYSFEAFYNVALFYSKIDTEEYKEACEFSAKSVVIYPEFISFIEGVRGDVEIILITSGLALSWQNVTRSHNLDSVHLMGGNYFPKDKYVVDQNVKGIVTDELRKFGKTTFAFGDSLVDFDMLKKADNAYLVVNEKFNKDILPKCKEISDLQQISFTDFRHEGVPFTSFENIRKSILKNNLTDARL